jgi:hypothetical protein
MDRGKHLKSDHLAQEASRLKNDEIFNKALADIRSDALNALATADADDKTMILRLQQKVAVIDEIRNVLDRYILAADVQEDAGSFA